MKKPFLIKYLSYKKDICQLMLLAILVYSAPLSAAKIYKWKDENGVLQFSSIPPEKNNKVTTMGSTNVKNKIDFNKAILGAWNWVGDDEQWNVRIFSNTIEFSHKPRNKENNKRKKGSMILNGKTMEVKYKNHYDLTKVGSVEKFFIVKVNDDILILSQLGTHKKLTYRKNDYIGRTNKKLSVNAKKLLGVWENFDGNRTIQFKNPRFFIREKEKHKRYGWSYKPRYSGSWSYNDPYIEFDVRTERKEGNNTPHAIMKKFKFYIIELNDTVLKVRNEHSNVEKFIYKGGR